MSKEKPSTGQFPYHIVTPLLFVAIWFLEELVTFFQFVQTIDPQDLLRDYGLSIVLGIVTVIGIVLITMVGIRMFYRKQAFKSLQVKRIILTTGLEADSKVIDKFLLDIYARQRKWYYRLIQGREWFQSLIYANDDNQIEWYMLYPRDRMDAIENNIKSHFPNIELYSVELADLPLPHGSKFLNGGHFRLNKENSQAGLPLQSFETSEIGSIMRKMAPKTWISIQFSPDIRTKSVDNRVKKALRNLRMTTKQLEDMFKIETDLSEKPLSQLTPKEKARYRSLFKMHTGREKPFRVTVSVWSENAKSDSVVQNIKASIKRVTEFDNYIFLKTVLFFKKMRCSLLSLEIIPMPWRTMVWIHSELATLMHFPDGKDAIYQEDEKKPQLIALDLAQNPIKKDDFTDGFFIGTQEHPLTKERDIHVPYQTWTYMSFGAGETGSGKTALLLNLIYKHLEKTWYHDENAPGITIFDPKGEDALKLMAKINSDLKRLEKNNIDIEPLKKRIHYFDLGSDQFSLGLNLLHKNEWDSNDVVVNNAMDLFKNVYPRDSMLFDRFGKLALHSLLLDPTQHHSILGVEQILRQDETFRNRVLPFVKGTVFENDWRDDKKLLKAGQVTQPVINRISNIRFNERMRRLFGQPNMGLEPAKFMDDGHIVIYNMSGLTKEERSIVAGFIITQYHLQAQKRKKKSKVHLNITDEFHLLQIPIVKQINAIDRYTGHCFVPVTQYADQINKDILQAFDGNVTTYIACTQGSESADIVQKMSRQSIDSTTIQNLKNLHAVVSTKNKDGERVTFEAKIPPPHIYFEDGQTTYFGNDTDRRDREKKAAFKQAKVLCDELMARDCTPVDEVDRWINDYLQHQTILSKAKASENEQEKSKQEEEEQEQQKKRDNDSNPLPEESEDMNIDVFDEDLDDDSITDF